MTMTNKHLGSSFDEFLKEDGLYEESLNAAVKNVIARQIEETMKAQHISKTEMAKRMNTSRNQLNRLLDPNEMGVSLEAMSRAAAVLGRKLHLELR
jgi:DNA-binding NtrC family response regulator